MEFKNLTSTAKIPVLGLGTWRMGGGLTADRSNDKKFIEAIQYAIKLGITHIDTAEIYGAGHTEELVGQAIRQLAEKSIDRKKLFITTKVSPQHLFTSSQIVNSCNNSLKRLQLNYIDLYLIHWPNPLASTKQVMATLDKLVSEGKIRFIGVSNFSVKQLQNVQKSTQIKIVTNQVHYSLLNRDPEKELLHFCQKEGIILTAYTPLEQGTLVGATFETLNQVAKIYKKTPAQVALRWLIEKPKVIVIPKATSQAHIRELTGCLGWRLKKKDQEFLENRL